MKYSAALDGGKKGNIMDKKEDEKKTGADLAEIESFDMAEVAAGLGVDLEFADDKADAGNATEKGKAADAGNDEGDAGDDDGNNDDGTDDDAGDDNGDAEGNDDDDAEDEDEDGDLPEKLKEKIEKRIGKEVGKRKALEEELATIRDENKKLNADLAEARGAKPVIVEGINPLMMLQTHKQVEEREEYLQNVIDWCEEHEDGYEKTDDKTGETVNYTAEDIRARKRAVTKELQRMIPKIRERVKMREGFDQVVKKVYPALMDAKSKDYETMTAILNSMPALNALPNVKLVIGDMIAGEAARKAKHTKRAPEEKVPAAPTKSAATTAIKNTHKKKTGGSSVMRFAEAGGTREALASEVEGIMEDFGI
jgi:hypothetical protein